MKFIWIVVWEGDSSIEGAFTSRKAVIETYVDGLHYHLNEKDNLIPEREETQKAILSSNFYTIHKVRIRR
jgi:hypothetical protein